MNESVFPIIALKHLLTIFSLNYSIVFPFWRHPSDLLVIYILFFSTTTTTTHFRLSVIFIHESLSSLTQYTVKVQKESQYT